MPFPSTLSTFVRPSATDRLNSPSHSALHNTVSSALGQVEAVIGVDGVSSIVGTMMYNLRSPASDGGGHVQAANKGGTGQTTFAKGDILVASSSSVLSKLAVGIDGQGLISNSSMASGVQWANIGSASTMIPLNAAGAATSDNVAFPSSLLGYTALSVVPLNISVNKMSMYVTNVTNAGTVRVGIYTEDGQTQKASAVFTSVAGTGVISTNVTSVFLSSGNYWSVLVPIDGRLTYQTWDTDSTSASTGLNALMSSVIGKKYVTGTQVVTAGTLPATFNPSILTRADNTGPIIRFDN